MTDASLLGCRLPAAVGTGTAHGTFGELLQGVLPDPAHRLGRDFLVTFPITDGSTATFRRDDQPGVRVTPRHKHKSALLVKLIHRLYRLPGGGLLDIDSRLPEGKGLASSSADLVATARAVADAHGLTIGPREIEALLRRIEPSDGVMYDGIVVFYHREVRLGEHLGGLPELAVIAHDEGGAVDTISYNRLPKDYDAADRAEYARLLAELREAVRAGHLPTVGRVATRSATLSTRVRPRPVLPVLLRACADVGGLGVVVAHSGTTAGILIDPHDAGLDDKVHHVRAACARFGGTVGVRRSAGEGA
jgi:L-threonine kinase